MSVADFAECDKKGAMEGEEKGTSMEKAEKSGLGSQSEHRCKSYRQLICSRARRPVASGRRTAAVSARISARRKLLVLAVVGDVLSNFEVKKELAAAPGQRSG